MLVIYRYIVKILRINLLKFGMIKLKLYKIFNKDLKKNIAIRNKTFQNFKQYFKLSRTFHTYPRGLYYIRYPPCQARGRV